MKAHPEISRNLRLEALETRTLLAADLSDPFGLVADFNLASKALSGSGEFHASFDTRFGNHQLIIDGSSESSLTIDLDKLPSYITNLKITSFNSVTLTGKDHVDNLILTGIGSFSAEGLSVDSSVVTTDVGSLSLASINQYIYVAGSEMKLSVDSFGDLGTIIAEVPTLTLSTKSNHVDIVPGQKALDLTLYLASVPASSVVTASGFNKIHVGLPPVDTPGSGVEDPGPGPGGTDEPGTIDPAPGGDGTVVVTPTPDGDGLVIITRPLDEQMRLYLEQLSQLLHSTQQGSDQQLLNLLNHGGPRGTEVNAVAIAESFESWNSPVLPDSKFGFAAPLTQTTSAGVSASTLSSAQFTAPSAEVWQGLNAFNKTWTAPTPASLPDGLGVQNLTEVDISWPVVLAPQETPSASRKSDNSDAPASTFVGSVQALGTYIVDRVVAEFSPGQQSLVLLVDPQPASRNSATSKKAASAASAPASLNSAGFVGAITEV